MHPRSDRHTVALFTLILSLCSSWSAIAQEATTTEITVENSSTHPLISPVAYDGVEVESLYVTMSDGVKLAADIARPTLNGVFHADPLPLVWTHHRYVRATVQNGQRIDVGRQGWLMNIARRGYIVAAVDTRGGGASFGRFDGPFTPRETADADEIIDWFTGQEWCDGNIGMYGGSYLGATQYMAASTGNEHLKAIIPSVAPGDLYAFAWAGGVYRGAFIQAWTDLTVTLDTQAPAAPVDADDDGSMLRDARSDHEANRNTNDQFEVLPYRDSVDEPLGIEMHTATSPLWKVEQISDSDTAIYHLAGWYDTFVRDAAVLYNNLDNPQRIAIGPWFHQDRHEFDNTGEHLRWFDRYLKGRFNGIDDELPVQYYVMGAPEGQRWRQAEAWPLPNEARTHFYFQPRAADRADGLLTRRPTQPNPGEIKYTVDYSTTSGTSNRWRNAHGGPGQYPDMTPNDEKGIAFTSNVLEADTEITGHPVADLYISTSADDGDFFVYLEEVDVDGVSHYITEGVLRASHRAIGKPPFDYLGLPYHPSTKEDIEPIDEQPVRLQFDLHPTSNIWDAGHRIRVTITCADRDNQDTPILDPPPTVTLHCSPKHPSQIVLPIIPAE